MEVSQPGMMNLSNDLSALGDASRAFLGREHRMLINGDFVSSASGETFETLDPSTAEVVASVPAGSAEDIDRAVLAARAAFDHGPWPRLKPADRERRILKLADLLERNAQEFAEIESVNSGRSIIGTRLFDVDLSVDYLRYMAGWATKIEGRTMTPTVPYVPDGNFSPIQLVNRLASLRVLHRGTCRWGSSFGSSHRRWRPAAPSF